MPRALILTVLTLALTAFLTGPLQAQTDQTGTLTGTVTIDGQPIPGAAVQLSQSDGALPRSAVTDARGRFRFGFLPPGTYTLLVQSEGFLDQRLTELRINASRSTALEIALQAAESFQEEVVVVAAEPLIDTATTEFDLILDSSTTEKLPISRAATDLVKFTPGASNQSVWGGSTDQANSYQLDGVSVNQPGFGGDFLLPNVDWIEEFQVKGLGAGAEYGNFQGGVVNIVTKSGGNALRGGLRANFEDDALNSSNLNTREAGFEDDRRLEFNADLSGPLVTDKLYYFASVQRAERDTRIVDDLGSSETSVAFLPVLEEREETKLFGKLTWQASDRDLLNFVLGSDDVETQNRGLDSFTAPEAATTQDSPSVFYNAAWSRTLGSSNFLELKASGYSGDDDRFPLNGERPAVQLLDGDRNLFRNATFTRLRSPESNALTTSLDSYFDTGEVSHHMKFGGEYEDGSWREQRLRNGGLTWRPETGSGPFNADDPSTWGFISSDWGSDIDLDAKTLNAALYVQDYIDITPALRLSAGLRFGHWEGELTPGFGGGTPFTAVEDDAIDLRLGAVYDFQGDGSWIGKIHWGRYHQSLFALLFDRVEGGNVFQDLEFWDWIGPGLPDVNRNYTLQEREQFFEFFRARPAGSEVGPADDYEQPYVDQLVAGVEHALNEDWKIGLTYVYRENGNIVALVDRNLASNYTEFNNLAVFDFRSGTPILDADGNPLVLPRVLISNDDILFVGGAPGLTDEQVAGLTFDQDLALTNPDGAFREMNQLQLTVDGRLDRLTLSGSVVYTDLEGNFFSVSGYDDPNGVGAGSFVNPNEGINGTGALRGVSEWEFKLRVSGDLPWNLRGGVFLTYTSGVPITPVYEIDDRSHDFITADGVFLDPDLFFGIGGESIFLEGRGSRELDSSFLADVHLDRVFPLGNTELILGFDLFNLFNEDAPTSVNTLVNDQDPSDPSTLFGSPRLRTTPRTSRLYASLRF